MPKSAFLVVSATYFLCAAARTVQLMITRWDNGLPVESLLGASFAEGLYWPLSLALYVV